MIRNIWLLVGSTLGVILAGYSLAVFIQPHPAQTPEGSVAGQSLDENTTCLNFTEATLHINDRKVQVALADTTQERSQGLSGCDSVPAESGLYFKFDATSQVSFWMKDMVIPIDIIWIRDGIVIGIESNVQPEIGAPEAQLRRYAPSQSVTGVLEVAAGQAQALNISNGTDINLEI